MSIKIDIKFILVFFTCLFIHNLANAQQELLNEKRIELALRSIGHEVLINYGNEDSRVLAIENTDGQYRIPFESHFGFNPDDIISIVDSVMTNADIATHYIVEVEECDTKEVVHSFEVGNKSNPDMMPCRGRDVPVGCYSISLSFLEGNKFNGNLMNSEELSASALPVGFISLFKTNPLQSASMFFTLFALLGFMSYFIWKRNNKRYDQNLILIGGSQFDKRNMALSFRNKKVDLSNKESELLSLLHDSVNSPIEREVILKKVWGNESAYIGRTLDVFISKLRKKLEEDSSVKIVNIRGVGYKLVTDERG